MAQLPTTHCNDILKSLVIVKGSQIAFHRQIDVGRMVGRFCRRWADVGLPTNTLVRSLYILPTLGQRWANVGLPTNTQVRCLYFANVGPTLGQRRIFIQDGGEQ